MPRNPKIIFEFQRARSEASRKGWEARWEKIYQREVNAWAHLGKKGIAYIDRKYGPGGDVRDYRDTWDGFEDFADTEIEY